MVENVSTNDAGVQDIVGVVVRADIRHYLNELSTAEFIKPEEKVKTIDRTKAAIQSRLEKYGIKVVSFNLETYKFERIRPDGSVDDSYQDKLDDINRMREETNLERARIATIVEQKKRRYNEVQAQVNRVVQEAEGSKQQAKLRGDSYLVAKKNEAEQILGSGKAEVAGTVERINALDGPGGKAILKLDIARQLQRNQAKFFVLNEGSQGQGLSVRRTDTNEILRQLGIQDATSEPGGNPKKFESRSKSSRTNEQGSETIEPEVSSVSQASGQHGQ
jgi:ribosomal protein L15